MRMVTQVTTYEIIFQKSLKTSEDKRLCVIQIEVLVIQLVLVITQYESISFVCIFWQSFIVGYDAR